jgi:hypothetical protein
MTLVPLLRLYPRVWRRRYGDEMALVVSAERPTIRLAVDLIAGAVDARLNPQWTPRIAADNEGGRMTMGNFLAHCQPVGITREDHIRSAAWMLGGTVAFTILYLLLKWTYGQSPFIEAFGLALFPISLALSARYTYLKKYSRPAASVLTAGTILVIFGVMLFATLLGERL